MRYEPLKRIATIVAVIGLCAGVSTSVNATITWPTPLTINSDNVVGAKDIKTPGDTSDIPHERDVANTLLAMVAGVGQPAPPFEDGEYVTSTIEYGTGGIGSATVTGGAQVGGAIDAGWEYALAKYDGPKAGWVLFYLGGDDTVLPNLPYSLWGNPTDTGFALSHATVFNAVPEPSTYIAGALLLIPLLAQARRLKRSA